MLTFVSVYRFQLSTNCLHLRILYVANFQKIISNYRPARPAKGSAQVCATSSKLSTKLLLV